MLNGLGFMWNPHTENVGLLRVAAATRRCGWRPPGRSSSASRVGFGIIITYASYLKPDDDIALSGLTAAAGNEFCEVALGGLITIPAAFVFLGPGAVAEAAGSTFDLGFKTLPMVFQYMPLGNVVGTLFFFLLFLAAMTSSVAMLQPAIALLEEGLGLRRHASVAVLGAITVAGTGFVVCLSKDLTALDTLDFWVGTFGIYLLATYPGDPLRLGPGHRPRHGGTRPRGRNPHPAPLRLHHQVRFAAVPADRLRLVGSPAIRRRRRQPVHGDRRQPVVLAAVLFILGTAALFAVLVACAMRRWRRLERANHGGRSMTLGGWIIMLLSVGFVTGLLLWSRRPRAPHARGDPARAQPGGYRAGGYDSLTSRAATAVSAGGEGSKCATAVSAVLGADGFASARPTRPWHTAHRSHKSYKSHESHEFCSDAVVPAIMERTTQGDFTIMNAPIRAKRFVLLAIAAGLLLAATAAAANLEVGPGKPFARIEDAAAKAAPGDVILFIRARAASPTRRRPSSCGRRGSPSAACRPRARRYVKISGKGFDYSGRGSTPRAIFQFNQGTDGCTLEGFELFAAHNGSHNGAGVRINQANDVTVRNCSIHNNDMGIMSNGDGSRPRPSTSGSSAA